MAKKEEIPSYVLRAFTSEYLIEGTVDGDTPLIFPARDELYGDYQFHNPIQFRSATIRKTRLPDSTVTNYSSYVLKQNQAVIYIPDIDYTRLPVSYWKNYKTPISGDFYIGHYRLTGKLMTVDRLVFISGLPAMDVHISSQLPGTTWDDLFVPFALVNMSELHGWSER